MAWIESHQELRNHPKTARLARKLSISKPCAVGHLHFFWWWAVDYAPLGSLSRWTNEEIADGSGWEEDATAFVDALRETGWLDAETNTIHDWDLYSGKLISKREANAERMRKARAESVQRTCNERAAHVQGLQTVQTVQERTDAHAREDARAREDSSAHKGFNVKGLITEQAWEGELAYGNARKAGYEPEEINTVLEEFVRKGKSLNNVSNYLLKTLQGRREDLANGHAPPKGTSKPPVAWVDPAERR